MQPSVECQSIDPKLHLSSPVCLHYNSLENFSKVMLKVWLHLVCNRFTWCRTSVAHCRRQRALSAPSANAPNSKRDRISTSSYPSLFLMKLVLQRIPTACHSRFLNLKQSLFYFKFKSLFKVLPISLLYVLFIVSCGCTQCLKKICTNCFGQNFCV